MKVMILFGAVFLMMGLCRGAPVEEGPTAEDEEAMLEELIEMSDQELERTRRSGFGLFEGKSSKLSQLTGLSSLSKHTPYDPHHIPVAVPHGKSLDLWGFKKAILATLVQAVKAITGGVIALKGELVKAKGNIVAAKGAVIKTKGEAISQFGRNLATKAIYTPIVPPAAYIHTGPAYVTGPAHYSVPSHVSTHHVTSYPSAPAYVAPHVSSSYISAPSGYGPSSYSSSGYGGSFGGFGGAHLKRDALAPAKKELIPQGVQAGLVVLKPVENIEGYSLGQQNVYHSPEAIIKSRADSYGYY